MTTDFPQVFLLSFSSFFSFSFHPSSYDLFRKFAPPGRLRCAIVTEFASTRLSIQPSSILTMALLGLLIFTFVLAVNASLSANYPVNAQLPPVARVSKPFKFVFSQGTFGESDEETKYSLSDAPSWLHVDSKSRTLSGTPQSDDAGDQKFKLDAKGPSGSASMDVTLAVSAEDGPKPGKPLLPQLAKFGASSPPSSFFIRPGDSFSMAFDSDTFVNTGNSTVYYGTSPENSPLPS